MIKIIFAIDTAKIQPLNGEGFHLKYPAELQHWLLAH